jgi:peptidoglycan hydrolase-like protein with peptidoglycan-binding domain
VRIFDLEESLSYLVEANELPTDIELSFGSVGDDVKAYQSALQSIGITPGPIDGKFGRETKAATIVFQNTHSLKTDGIAGVKTLTALNKALKGGAPSGQAGRRTQIAKKETPVSDAKWGRVKPENAKKVFDFFVDQGYSDVQSAGIVGNLSVESLFKNNPAQAVNPVDTNGLPSKGLAQWQPDRWKKLGKFSGTAPENTTLRQQLQFLAHELETSHKKAGDLLRNVSGSDMSALKQAVTIIRKYYEVAAPTHDSQRFSYAKLALKTFSDSVASADEEDSLG